MHSCSITKHVPENQFLLDENNFKIQQDTSLLFSKHENIDEEEMQDILKQKPNRKILGRVRFYLRLYNLSSEKRIVKHRIKQQKKAERKNKRIHEKNEKKQKKVAKKNEQLKAKGIQNDTIYPPLEFRPKPPVEPKLTFGERVRESGEKPVIIDSVKTVTSAKQLNIYLINKGYFNNTVDYQITYYPDTIPKRNGKFKVKHKRKANRGEIDYLINLEKPYRIKGISYNVTDTLILNYLDSIDDQAIIKTNQIYDSEKLNKERERITTFLMNNGYKYFNKEFIYFKIDSNLNSNQVNVELRIQNYKYKDPVYDTILERNHAQYNVMKVEIYPDFSLKADDYAYKDSLFFTKNISIISRKELGFKPKLLYNSVRFMEGDLYNQNNVIATYKTLSSLGTFESTAIEFDTLENGCNDLVAKIRLKPAKTQSFTIATDGTHRNGLLGIEGRVAYSHKNIFKGAEKLQISLSGGIEMQQLLVDQSADEDGLEDVISNFSSFNTIEFGPLVNLTIPRFVFIGKLFPKAYNPKTEFSGVINYQKRPDFTRNKENFSFGYVWHEKSPITYRFTPINISAIDITKSDAFQQKIDELNDRLLAASYQDHIIASTKLSFTYNGQDIKKKQKNQYYFQSIFETAGNSLRAFYNLTNQELNSDGAYEFLGIRFAQFAKLSGDFRHYNNLTKRIRVVSRVAGGVGIPLKNLNEALPFEKSFYAGGANGMRAWKARTLGPGSYYDSTRSFDKIGDIQLEGNFEIRFPISSWIEGATFLDAGNIWLINEDSLRTGAEFKAENFIAEIGIGTGFGLRMDLDFFIIRFDFAFPLRNPALPVNERWIGYGKLSDYSSYNDGSFRRSFFPWQFNLGIGYPF
ncbi:MAG: BamA/TamA family outer membrane protein [Flavobacteriales bacterium]|jgi:hypothetical protein|nr:BamA/TamA family outer membrane protein [Flavobacteriales bacterium]